MIKPSDGCYDHKGKKCRRELSKNRGWEKGKEPRSLVCLAGPGPTFHKKDEDKNRQKRPGGGDKKSKKKKQTTGGTKLDGGGTPKKVGVRSARTLCRQERLMG